MSPGTGEADGHHPAGLETTLADPAIARQQLDTRDGSAPPQVHADLYAPAGRRRLELLLVVRCPFGCPGGTHVHRGPLGDGVRRAGCGRGTYTLRPTDAAGLEVVA